MQRRENEVAGQRGLHRHVGRLAVPNLAHHDHVGILPHQRAQTVGKRQVDAGLHLHLVQACVDHLDRILDRADVHLVGGQLLQSRVQRGRLARAGRARHQHDAGRATDQFRPDLRLRIGKAELGVAAHHDLGIEDPHHQLFAERGGQRRQADFHLAASSPAGPRLDAPVQRPPPLDHIHPAQQLDAADHRMHHARRHLVDLMQHAVDPEAHDALVALGLHVDVAGALIERVLQDPVDDVDHVRVVGLDLGAELDELLEIAQKIGGTGLGRPLHLLRQLVELGRVAGDVDRIGDHALHGLLGDLFDLAHPVVQERLAGGHHDFGGLDRDRQNRIPGGIGAGHHVHHPREVDPQRIDVLVRQLDLFGQPLRQRLQIEQPALRIRSAEIHFGQHRDRVPKPLAVADREHPLRIRLRQPPVGHQLPDHVRKRQPAADRSLDRLARLRRALRWCAGRTLGRRRAPRPLLRRHPGRVAHSACSKRAASSATRFGDFSNSDTTASTARRISGSDSSGRM